MKKKKTVWLAALFVIIVVGFVVYSTFQGQRVTCRVCIVFNGQRDCRTASASTRMEAQRTATTNACAQLASGVTDSVNCENTRPVSVDWQ
jgi:hypothetical protein